MERDSTRGWREEWCMNSCGQGCMYCIVYSFLLNWKDDKVYLNNNGYLCVSLLRWGWFNGCAMKLGVKFDSLISSSTKHTCGVPQGLILVPILFSIYMLSFLWFFLFKFLHNYIFLSTLLILLIYTNLSARNMGITFNSNINFVNHENFL